MATWVRSGTGTAPSSLNLALSGRYALSNGTAPGDFDPAGVTSVQIVYTITGSGFVDDRWTDLRAASLDDGSNIAAAVNGTDAGSLANVGSSTNQTNNSPNAGLTTTQWESMAVSGGVGVNGDYTSFQQSMGPDGGTLTMSALTVTITYTPAAAGPNEGAATGSIAWSGSGTGAAARGGSSSGSVAWSGSAAGEFAAEGSAAGSVAWSGSASGQAPAGTSEGSATGSISWAGASEGTTSREGSAGGSVGWVGAADGTADHEGSGSGAVAWSGAADGVAVHGGSAPGSVAWSGSATGESPAEGVEQGSASGSIAWVGTADGVAVHEGAATGAIAWAGSATGESPAQDINDGSASGAISWVGSATGARSAGGSAAGDVAWVGSGAGSNGGPVPRGPRIEVPGLIRAAQVRGLVPVEVSGSGGEVGAQHVPGRV